MENTTMRAVHAISVIIVFSLIIGCSSEQVDEESTWYNYGTSITEADVIKVSYAIENIDDLTETPVVIEGTISQVCQTRGCWMVVEDEGQIIRVRFADYSFFVPWESSGKTVRMQGTLQRDTVSEETARQWAEGVTDPVIKPEDIHGDQEIVMMMATAVSIKDGTPLSDEQMAVIGENGDHEHTH